MVCQCRASSRDEFWLILIVGLGLGNKLSTYHECQQTWLVVDWSCLIILRFPNGSSVSADWLAQYSMRSNFGKFFGILLLNALVPNEPPSTLGKLLVCKNLIWISRIMRRSRRNESKKAELPNGVQSERPRCHSSVIYEWRLRLGGLDGESGERFTSDKSEAEGWEIAAAWRWLVLASSYIVYNNGNEERFVATLVTLDAVAG